MCHKACLFKAESSRKIDKWNAHEVRPPKIMKNEKHPKRLQFHKSIENINARFLVSNDMNFLHRKMICAKNNSQK